MVVGMGENNQLSPQIWLQRDRVFDANNLRNIGDAIIWIQWSIRQHVPYFILVSARAGWLECR